ncbi:MAG: XRE family transcriptional regulator [Pseudomonadota bacterium]
MAKTRKNQKDPKANHKADLGSSDSGLRAGDGDGLSKTPPRIGAEILRLRQSRGFTLDDLAERSGVSKSLLSQIERDLANPTLATIWRISDALHRRMEDLFSAQVLPIQVMTSEEIPQIIDEKNGTCLRILNPVQTVSWLQWYELIIKPKGVLDSDSHGKDTYEHLYLQAGTVHVLSGETEMTLEVGQTMRYPTDVRHTIRNVGASEARALMVNTLVTL